MPKVPVAENQARLGGPSGLPTRVRTMQAVPGATAVGEAVQGLGRSMDQLGAAVQHRAAQLEEQAAQRDSLRQLIGLRDDARKQRTIDYYQRRGAGVLATKDRPGVTQEAMSWMDKQMQERADRLGHGTRASELFLERASAYRGQYLDSIAAHELRERDQDAAAQEQALLVGAEEDVRQAAADADPEAVDAIIARTNGETGSLWAFSGRDLTADNAVRAQALRLAFLDELAVRNPSGFDQAAKAWTGELPGGKVDALRKKAEQTSESMQVDSLVGMVSAITDEKTALDTIQEEDEATPTAKHRAAGMVAARFARERSAMEAARQEAEHTTNTEFFGALADNKLDATMVGKAVAAGQISAQTGEHWIAAIQAKEQQVDPFMYLTMMRTALAGGLEGEEGLVKLVGKGLSTQAASSIQATNWSAKQARAKGALSEQEALDRYWKTQAVDMLESAAKAGSYDLEPEDIPAVTALLGARAGANALHGRDIYTEAVGLVTADVTGTLDNEYRWERLLDKKTGAYNYLIPGELPDFPDELKAQAMRDLRDGANGLPRSALLKGQEDVSVRQLLSSNPDYYKAAVKALSERSRRTGPRVVRGRIEGLEELNQ